MAYIPFEQIVSSVVGSKMGSFERNKVEKLERDLAAKRTTVDSAVGQLKSLFEYKLSDSEIYKIKKDANYCANK